MSSQIWQDIPNSTICRFCLEENTNLLTKIFIRIMPHKNITTINTTIKQTLQLLNIQIVTNDGYPNWICRACKAFLYSVKHFIAKAKESELQFEQMQFEQKIDILEPGQPLKCIRVDDSLGYTICREENEGKNTNVQTACAVIEEFVGYKEVRPSTEKIIRPSTTLVKNQEAETKVEISYEWKPEQDYLENGEDFKKPTISQASFVEEAGLDDTEVIQSVEEITGPTKDEETEAEVEICYEWRPDQDYIQNEQDFKKSTTSKVPCDEEAVPEDAEVMQSVEEITSPSENEEAEISAGTLYEWLPTQEYIENEQDDKKSITAGEYRDDGTEGLVDSSTSMVTLSIEKTEILPSFDFYDMKKRIVGSSRCPICGIRSTSMMVHIRTHTKVRPYKCDLCEKAYFSSNKLKCHKKSTHSSERNFSCKLCGKSFALMKILRAHELSHTGEKKFICTVCEKRFIFRWALAKHERTHTGEKPFACTVEGCGKYFSSSSNLRQHDRTHILPSQRTTNCDICKKPFCTKFALKVHQNTQHKSTYRLNSQ